VADSASGLPVLEVPLQVELVLLVRLLRPLQLGGRSVVQLGRIDALQADGDPALVVDGRLAGHPTDDGRVLEGMGDVERGGRVLAEPERVLVHVDLDLRRVGVRRPLRPELRQVDRTGHLEQACGHASPPPVPQANFGAQRYATVAGDVLAVERWGSMVRTPAASRGRVG
jgi:hypothetical protein